MPDPAGGSRRSPHEGPRPGRLAVALVLALTAAAGACGASGPTPTAATPSTPVATSDLPPPTAVPNPVPTPVAGDLGAGLVLTVANIAFEPTELAAPAGAPFAVQLRNADAGVPHNLVILDPSGQSVFRGEIVVGPAVVSYAVPALAAGRYTFNCTVHPNMTGILAVGG